MGTGAGWGCGSADTKPSRDYVTKLSAIICSSGSAAARPGPGPAPCASSRAPEAAAVPLCATSTLPYAFLRLKTCPRTPRAVGEHSSRGRAEAGAAPAPAAPLQAARGEPAHGCTSGPACTQRQVPARWASGETRLIFCKTLQPRQYNRFLHLQSKGRGT